MPTKLSRCHAVHFFSAVLISWLGSTIAAGRQRDPWRLVQIPDPVARRAAIAALESASTRFAEADCARIFTDFEDGTGRSLADRLSSIADDIRVYLTMVTFIDDSRHSGCASGAVMITATGSRVVRVCVEEFKRIHAQRPDYVVASLMHEILHTLGLGENPPSSREITARVLARCGRQPAGKRLPKTSAIE